MKLTQAQTLSNWQWILSSPMLLEDNKGDSPLNGNATDSRNLNWDTLGFNPNAQRDHEAIVRYVLDRPHQRLGIQFEHLLACALNACTNVIHNQRNVQISDYQKRHSKTLGELDFLCRFSQAQDHEWCHIESAVKFYLADCASPKALMHMDSWIGPNRKDRLDLKVHRLLTHQLTLTDLDICRDQLGLADKTVDKRLFVKGRLYLPRLWQTLGDKALRGFLPAQVNTGVELGWWSTLEAFKQDILSDHPRNEGCWMMIERHAWMGPPAFFTHAPQGQSLIKASFKQIAHRPFPDNHMTFFHNAQREHSDCLNWLSKLERLMNDVKRPVQIVFYTKNTRKQLGNKAAPQRFFITPNDWPQNTLPL